MLPGFSATLGAPPRRSNFIVYSNVHVFVFLHVFNVMSTLETANRRCGWRASESTACATEKTRTALLIVVS